MSDSAEVVIVGAGLAGVATAYELAVRRRMTRVVLVDEREPLTLTSERGTQAYRAWWPGPDDTMQRFMMRSITLLEEMADASGNHLRLNRRGYLFLSTRDDGESSLRETARTVARFGMGEIREHDGDAPSYAPSLAEGYRGAPDGADLLPRDALARHYPYLDAGAIAGLHVRRAGWLNAIAFGAWMLRRALGAGVRLVHDAMTRVETAGGRVRGVALASGARIDAPRVVLAAGPKLPDVLALLGTSLPLHCELHAKLLIGDPRRAVPRDAPFLIRVDPISLPWTDDDRRRLEARGDASHVLGEMPGGVHLRPVDGPAGDELYVIWTYDVERRAFVWPPAFDPHYGEAAIRGAASIVPALAAYRGHADRGVVDGGYYCKTPENRPVLGPLGALGPDGAFVCGGLSGFGVMGSPGAAEVVAAHLAGDTLPPYASAFLPARYGDPDYRERLTHWGDTGQL